MPESKAATDATTKPKDGPVETGKQTTLPMRSVADEAAQKAKEMRLKTLREKVHGKKAEDSGSESSSKTITAKPEKEAEDKDDATEEKPHGLQSPTSGAWKNKSGDDALRETVQSPTSGKWRPKSGDMSGVTAHNRATVTASDEEIKKAEKELIIKEDPEEEKAAETNKGSKEKEVEEDDDDDEDEDSEEDDSEDEEDDEDEEEEEEDDDDDEDEEDEDEEEENEKDEAKETKQEKTEKPAT